MLLRLACTEGGLAIRQQLIGIAPIKVHAETLFYAEEGIVLAIGPSGGSCTGA